MKKLVFGLFFISSAVCAEGKHPEWWCRVQSTAGQEYLNWGLTAEEACGQALIECRKDNKECTIESYGEW